MLTLSESYIYLIDSIVGPQNMPPNCATFKTLLYLIRQNSLHNLKLHVEKKKILTYLAVAKIKRGDDVFLGGDDNALPHRLLRVEDCVLNFAYVLLMPAQFRRIQSSITPTERLIAF